MRTRLAWVMALAAIGCGGGGTSIDKACTDLAQAQCMKRASCTSGTGITRTWGDMATCLTREKLACTIGLSAPQTGSTPATTETCVKAFANVSCADFLNNNPPAECIPTGPKASGAPCAFGGQCQSGYCDSNKTATCGTCGDAPPDGASCRNSNCARQAECAVRVLTCTTIPGEGDPCDNNTAPCGADLSCLGNTGGAMGTCTAGSATAGATCSATMGCDGTMGLVCTGTTTRTCTAISEGADGADCGSLPMGVFAGCAGGGLCYGAMGVALAGEAGTCSAPAADGDACDILAGPPCLSPARCVVTGGGTAGTCTVPSGSTCG
jgi:hypothetical protein